MHVKVGRWVLTKFDLGNLNPSMGVAQLCNQNCEESWVTQDFTVDVLGTWGMLKSSKPGPNRWMINFPKTHPLLGANSIKNSHLIHPKKRPPFSPSTQTPRNSSFVATLSKFTSSHSVFRQVSAAARAQKAKKRVSIITRQVLFLELRNGHCLGGMQNAGRPAEDDLPDRPVTRRVKGEG